MLEDSFQPITETLSEIVGKIKENKTNMIYEEKEPKAIKKERYDVDEDDDVS